MSSGDSVAIRWSSSSIPSLLLSNRDGYSSWKFKMRNYLIHEDLWCTINGYDEGDATSEQVKSRNDKRALAKICLTVDGSAITHVRSAKSALEAWKALQDAYEDKGMGRRLALERKLYRLSLNDFQNIEMYINAVLSTAQDLADIGKVIEDASIAAILLGGLSSKYEPLIMALENSNVEVSTELVKRKLLNEMSKLDSTETVAAFQLKNRSDIDVHKTKKKKPVVCYECNKPGHKRPDCPLRNKAKKGASPSDGGTTSFSALGSSSLEVNKWFIDSGASKHMTPRRDWFKDIKPLEGSTVTVANGQKIDCGGIGDISINTVCNVVNRIKDVAYVPKLTNNLISVKKVVDKGFTVLFDKNGCSFYKDNDFSFKGEAILHGSACGGLYTLDCTTNSHQNVAYEVHSDTLSRYLLWHKRLGHLCRIGMNQLKNSHVGIDYTEIDKSSCVACVEGKQARKPFKTTAYKKATAKLELIHSDLCGPMSETSFQGNKYVLIFIDDFSRMIYPYFIASKAQVKEKFCIFQALVERQTGAKIKRLRTDCGKEYVNKELADYLATNGVSHETTVGYSPQSNGVAERTNRSIVEKARSMLAQSSLSKAYWEDAFKTAVYLKNRSPHRALERKTPFEKWNGNKGDLTHLRVFGCRALIQVPACQRKKLDLKTKEVIFVGYSEDPNGYYFRDSSNPRSIQKSRDVTFFENHFSQLKGNAVESVKTEPVILINEQQQDENEVRQEINSVCSDDENDYNSAESEVPTSPEQIEAAVDQQVSRYPTRIRKQPDFFTSKVFSEEIIEPKSYLEAVNANDADRWLLAMTEEHNSLIKLKTWKLVDRPNGNKKVIPCKWVYKLKMDADGNIMKYKARLVVKGFRQVEGVDYTETFAPVVRHSSLRTLFALAVEMDLKMRHLDVDTAFLNGDLEEEVFMEQPQGFVKKGQEAQVCLLQKSLYGLKQAPRVWNRMLDKTLLKLGFEKTPSEPCVYKKLFGIELVILAVFVDDIIVFYQNEITFDTVKHVLKNIFSIKDLGELKYYLGLNIHRSDDGKVKISQRTFILSLLKKFGMDMCKTVETPSSLKKLTTGNGEAEYPFQSLVGSLMFLAVNTRPDIAFVTSYLSQFNTKFNKEHWLELKRVLQYLRGTIDYALTYRKTGEYLKGYTDADWANCSMDRKSYTGYYFMLAGGPVMWQAKKQQTTALSSTEAEYMALTAAAKEACYLRRFVSEITGKSDTVTLFNDSQSAQSLVYNPVHHERTKHIDTRYHFIREKVSDGIIDIKFVRSDLNFADMLTKPLGRVAHKRCVAGLDLA